MIKIEVKINGVSTCVDALKLEKLADGLFAKNYNEDFTIDTIAENEIKEATRIKEIKEKAGEIIFSKYSNVKQLNIIRLGGEELVEMSLFIKKIKDISDKAELDGLEVKDIKWQ